MALYMGPSSNFGYGGAPAMGGQPPRAPGIGVQPTQQFSSPVASKTVPTGGASAAAPTRPLPPNVLGPEAVRSSAPSGSLNSYDAPYLQNLASAIGGLFTNRQGGNTMNLNPLGNLSEISPGSGIGGNAPTQGLPLTWLQQALNGGGFSTPQPAAPTVKPKAPQVTKPVNGRYAQ
jgi:hypothetical protein